MQLSRIDLNLFTVFDAIYREGGITPASRRLGNQDISQLAPACSARATATADGPRATHDSARRREGSRSASA